MDLTSDFETSSSGSNTNTQSKRTSVPPVSRRKRRRSQSDTSNIAARRWDVEGSYNDNYRRLFNEVVSEAASRFVPPTSVVQPAAAPKARIGASVWSAKEKEIFFAALERLGKHDLPGIAEAIGTKSLPEVQELLLLLQDGVPAGKKTEVMLRDVEAAFEISLTCTERLELAGNALALFQERFEAREEQDKYGEYWLITPDVAERIEAAVRPPHESPEQSSPLGRENDVVPEDPASIGPSPPILQDVPEGNLLHVKTLLELSSSIFMNSSPTLNFPFPNWSTIVTHPGEAPSIYRTALKDFHTLVVSITSRLIQASINQATARIRSNDWRTKRGPHPCIIKQDVFTALDILNMPRNGRERWRGVARRCGLRVRKGKVRRNEGRDLEWDEVEAALGVTEGSQVKSDKDDETVGASSGVDDDDKDDIFKRKAARSGTPLPGWPMVSPESDEGNSDYSYDAEGSIIEESSGSESRLSSSASSTSLKQGQSSNPANQDAAQTLEDFDLEVSLAEERKLWDLLGTPPPRSASIKRKDIGVTDYMFIPSEGVALEKSDWQDWTDYRAEWEELAVPIPMREFRANLAPLRPSMADLTRHGIGGSTSAYESNTESDRGTRKRQKRAQAELPIRGARAYALLQEQNSASAAQGAKLDDSEGDTKTPIPSIEGPMDDSNDSSYDGNIH
jgi:RNA polymerase I-specific transcription initiation factor RRN5